MKTNGLIITKAGQNLFAKALVENKNLNITKVKIGTGNISSIEEAKNLLNIVDFYKEIDITNIENINENLVRIRSVFTNENFTETVTIKEYGLFAEVNGLECLLAYVNDDPGEEFPAGSTGNIMERVRDIYLGVSTDINVTATIDKNIVYATIYDLEESEKRNIEHLSQVLGIEYKGILNNNTNKEAGFAYYDTMTKSMYRCIAQTNLNYADSQYFEALSNNNLLDKLQNLVNTSRIYIDNKITAYKIEFGDIRIIFGCIDTIASPYTLNYPSPFVDDPYVAISNWGTSNTTHSGRNNKNIPFSSTTGVIAIDFIILGKFK